MINQSEWHKAADEQLFKLFDAKDRLYDYCRKLQECIVDAQASFVSQWHDGTTYAHCPSVAIVARKVSKADLAKVRNKVDKMEDWLNDEESRANYRELELRRKELTRVTKPFLGI